VLAVGLHVDEPVPVRRQPFELVNLLHASHLGRLRGEDVLLDPPRWLLWGLRIPTDLIRCGSELEELRATRYREVAAIGDPRRAVSELLEETVPRTLMIPWSRPWTVARPGPAMVLYERVDTETGGPSTSSK
jgi:hypothetical protein